MTSDVEYLLLKDKGPYHEVFVRRRLNTNPGACKFYTIVIAVIAVCLVVLLFSLVYVFVLVPSWQGEVLAWDGRPANEARLHVLTHTQCGLVEGGVEKGIYVFKGLPYALPPTGSRRWADPQDMTQRLGTCWKGTLQTKQFKPECVQFRDSNPRVISGQEDCLFLNVWTQSLDPLANRPVMIWFHGGDFTSGSGNMAGMSPTPEVTKATNAVYVSFNYRLGPLGFWPGDGEREGTDGVMSGNWGLMDSLLVLRWVKDNIRNFGGNPNKVTLFGNSAGGSLIQGLLTSPKASGLYQRAWMSSAFPIFNSTSTQSEDLLQNVLNATQCAHAACLRSLSAADVFKAFPWKQFPTRGQMGSIPSPAERRMGRSWLVVDGRVLKEQPIKAWRHGRGNDVPVIFTTMAQEADFVPFDPTIQSWSWPHYSATVTQQLSALSSVTQNSALSTDNTTSPTTSLSSQALKLYPVDSSLTPEFQYSTLVSDVRFNCPTNLLAEAASTTFRSSVYRGVITSPPSSAVNLLNISSAHYAFHGWDILAFFGDFHSFNFHPTSHDLLLQEILRQQIMAFARDGRPEAPVWESAQACTALLSDHVFPVEKYNKRRCDFWRKTGFFAGLV